MIIPQDAFSEKKILGYQHNTTWEQDNQQRTKKLVPVSLIQNFKKSKIQYKTPNYFD